MKIKFLKPAAGLAATILLSLVALGGEIVTWEPSPSPDVDRYRVYWATNLPVTTVQSATVTNQLSWINLSPGRCYYYVTAISTNDLESDPSETAFRPSTPPAPLLKGGPGELISWAQAPGVDQVTSYRLYSTNNPFAPLEWPLLTETTNTWTINPNAQKAAYFLRYVNPYGYSDPSPVVARPGGPTNPKIATQ